MQRLSETCARPCPPPFHNDAFLRPRSSSSARRNVVVHCILGIFRVPRRPSAHNFDITHLLGPSAQGYPILIPIRRGGAVLSAWLGTLDPPAAALRFSATSAIVRRPPSSRRAPFFSYSDVPPGLAFVLCANVSSTAPRPRCACPLPWSRSLDEEPGATSALLSFRRREYQSISVSASFPARAASFPRDSTERGERRSGQRIARFSLLVSLWPGRTPLFSWAYIGAGKDDPHASAAGSGIGLHRARRWWWEWEGLLVRRTSRRRPAREVGYDGERRVCVSHIDNCGVAVGGVRAAGQRRCTEGAALCRQTSASHLRTHRS
ncbi:hypothetical protein B0H14DRAFT_3509774 [Mycena olivaceomarginata]|nr:hypothetical protein B0H14DRAFT_3509774 [Mycena olivaceomarginata]